MFSSAIYSKCSKALPLASFISTLLQKNTSNVLDRVRKFFSVKSHYSDLGIAASQIRESLQFLLSGLFLYFSNLIMGKIFFVYQKLRQSSRFWEQTAFFQSQFWDPVKLYWSQSFYSCHSCHRFFCIHKIYIKKYSSSHKESSGF